MHQTIPRQTAAHQTIEELNKLTDLCRQLRFPQAGERAHDTLLTPLSQLIGADSAAFRSVSIQAGRACVADVDSIGVSNNVRDAYLEHFQYLDPIRTILPHLVTGTVSTPVQADTPPSRIASSLMISGSTLPPLDADYRRSLSQYWKEFLRPNNLYHHAGFLLRSNDRRAWLLNFHRPSRASAFSELELARVKLIGGILQAQVEAFTQPNTEADLMLAPLSVRERHVCDAIAQGMSNRQVADTLQISVRTVENHLRNIYRKLGIVSRTQLTSLFRHHY